MLGQVDCAQLGLNFWMLLQQDPVIRRLRLSFDECQVHPGDNTSQVIFI